MANIVENEIMATDTLELNIGDIHSHSDISSSSIKAPKLYIIRCVLLNCTIEYLGEVPEDIRLLLDLLPEQQRAVLENLDGALILDTILRGVKELRAYYSDTLIEPSGVPTTMKIGTNIIQH